MTLPQLHYGRTDDPSRLIPVDRALADLRRGGFVGLRRGREAYLMLAGETVSDETLVRLRVLSGNPPRAAITPPRAAALGLGPEKAESPISAAAAAAYVLPLARGTGAGVVRLLADPLATVPGDFETGGDVRAAEEGGAEHAALALTKLARLLPAAVIAPLQPLEDGTTFPEKIDGLDLMVVEAADAFRYEEEVARHLRAVGEAHIPLEDAADTRVIAFRPDDGGTEHLAIVIGQVDTSRPVLVRLHSECLTGDLLGSLRCDCGPQLRGAIKEIATNGAGIVLYLAQEGRGIGLVNKLHAYRLQDEGLDTFDANERVGYEADERVYIVAAEMLKQLRVDQVRLMTNNPDKMRHLEAHGVEVTERVAHVFPSNPHNERYLFTKADKGGHLL